MSTPTSTPGRAIGGRYRLDASVGRGGMGTVWEAYDETLRRRVAVKEVLLPPGIPVDERAMLCERTLREARSAARLTHPSVVVIYDVVEEDDRPWIVMELLNARSLAELVRDTGPLPVDQVASVGLQVLAALEAAHAAGILHRDVKPGNVLLAPDGRATLTDFGVARATGDSALTSTGLLLGSPSYISPECARGGDPTPASDLWALGATLYAAVEGQAPFERGDPLPTLTAVVGEPPDPMRRAGPLQDVLAGLLTKDPAYRWGTERTRSGLRAALPGASAHPGPTSAPPLIAGAPAPQFAYGPPGGSAPPATGSTPPPWSPPQDDDVGLAALFGGSDADRTGAGATAVFPPVQQQREQQGGWPQPPAGPPPDPARAAAASPYGAPSRVRSPGSRGQSSRRPLLITLLVVGLAVVIIAGYLVGTRLSGGSDTDSGSAPAGPLGRSSTPSASTPSASASASTAAGTSLRTYTSSDGYRVKVPAGWTSSDRGNGVTDFTAGDGSRFLRYGAASAPTDALTLLTQGERTFENASTTRDYQRVRLGTAEVQGRDGAVWEFRFTTASGERRHARYETFVDNGVAYELYASSADDQWSASQSLFTRSIRTFSVTG